MVLPSLFLIISPKTRRLLYVGESMRTVLGHDTTAYLGRRWGLVSGIVVEEFREGFSAAIGQCLLGLNPLPLFIKVRSASGKSMDCEIGSSPQIPGQGGECIVTCKFAPGRGSAVTGKNARRVVALPGPGSTESSRADTRRDVARKLHETVAQDLFLCKGKLIALRGASGEKQRAQFLAEALGFLDDSTASFRGALSSLSSPEAPDLKRALGDVVRLARERYGLDVRLRVPATLPALGSSARELILSSARELLTNVYKHSGQGAARVILTRVGGGARLDVVDSGTGISGEHLGLPGHGASRLGLTGIREQAARLGGTLKIRSRALSCTRVSVILPGGGAS